MTLHEDLKSLLKKDERLVSDDKLLKNKIVELALKLDRDLIRLLLRDKKIKEHFFEEVEKTLVFDREKFMKFVDNKEFLPDSYTAFKNKIGLTADKKYLAQSKEVVLSWPYKDCILEGGQEKEDEKRKEIFHNEILAPDEIDRLLEPKVFTNFKRIDAKGEHKVTETKANDNLIIKGNNLLVLHSLKKKFAGTVKLIYIDVPYNTGNDSFKYNDNFNHSTWLTFMRNRLEVAKQLLSNEGAIFVQCDDNEAAYLKVIMDEIFGEENNDIIIYVQVRYGEKTLAERNNYQKLIEQIHVYKKPNFQPNKEEEEYTLDKFEWEIKELTKGKKVQLGHREATIFKPGEYEIKKVKAGIDKLKETWASGTVLKANASGKFFNDFISPRYKTDGLEVLYKVEGIGEDGLGYRYFSGPKREGATKGKFYSGVPTSRREELESGKSVKLKAINNYYNFADSFGNCRHEGGVELRSGKKPEILLKKILDIATQEDDLILDFFAGTGGTCAVAHKMGRQYIGVEQLDYGENDSVIRLKNVIGKEKTKGKLSPIIEDYDTTGISEAVNWKGGGDFVYCELKEFNEEFVQKIKKAKDTKELIKIWGEMKQHAFLSYRIDPKLFDENIEEFKALSSDDQKKLLIKCLDANNLYVNYSEIEDKQYDINKEDKELNKKFYGGL